MSVWGKLQKIILERKNGLFGKDKELSKNCLNSLDNKTKYYIYISETKLDMLYPQIPHDQRTRIAKELKIDLKLFSASIEEEKDLKETKYSKAELVTRYIQNNCEVGTINKPKDYIHDILDMKWGPYGMEPEGSPVVFFGGETDLTIFGMGGSAHHIIGSIGNSNTNSFSITPNLFSYLCRQLEIQPDKRIKQQAEVWDKKEMDVSKTALTAVEIAVTQMEGPSERLEIFAKTLLTGTGRTKKVVLATPIYVALAKI